MANATNNGIKYKQCVKCSEITSLMQCATCDQYK